MEIGFKIYKNASGSLEPDTVVEQKDSGKKDDEGKPIYEPVTVENPAPNTYKKYFEAMKACKALGCHFEDKGEFFEVVKNIERVPTEAEQLASRKAERADAVSRIIVEVDGMVFNADLTAIQLMSATLSIAMANKVDFKATTIPWVLAEDRWTEVTIETLAKVAMQAGLSLANEWVKPYPKIEQVSNTEEVK